MKVSELLQRPDGWCQCSYAQTVDGVSCSVKETYAEKFCLRGAVQACHNDPWEDRAESRLFLAAVGSVLAARAGLKNVCFNIDKVTTWNDAPGRKQEEVVALVKEAEDLLASGFIWPVPLPPHHVP